MKMVDWWWCPNCHGDLCMDAMNHTSVCARCNDKAWNGIHSRKAGAVFLSLITSMGFSEPPQAKKFRQEPGYIQCLLNIFVVLKHHHWNITNLEQKGTHFEK